MSASPTSPSAAASSSPKQLLSVASPAAAALRADPSVFRGNTTNSVVTLEDPKNVSLTPLTTTTAAAAAAAGAGVTTNATIADLHWSAFYVEKEDVFGDFYTFELQQKQAAALAGGLDTAAGASSTGAQLAAAMATAITVPKGVTIPPPSSGGGGAGSRRFSARQLSGQMDDEVARSWEEDWEDEDVEDGFDVLMGKIAKGSASVAQE